MIGVFFNPNSVYIPVIQTGCLTTEFDSTYPAHLNGIISQKEFRKSINRINRAISSNKTFMVLAIIFGFCTISGMICIGVGGLIGARFYYYGFPLFISAGLGLSMFGSLLFFIGCVTVQFQRVARMRVAIASESMKYSSRLPTPCNWRLDEQRNFSGRYSNRSHILGVCHLVIDIGNSTVPRAGVYYSNQRAPASTLVLGHRYNCTPPPPPYFSLPTGFCSQCRAPRQDLASKFCSSCGYSFHQQ